MDILKIAKENTRSWWDIIYLVGGAIRDEIIGKRYMIGIMLFVELYQRNFKSCFRGKNKRKSIRSF